MVNGRVWDKATTCFASLGVWLRSLPRISIRLKVIGSCLVYLFDCRFGSKFLWLSCLTREIGEMPKVGISIICSSTLEVGFPIENRPNTQKFGGLVISS